MLNTADKLEHDRKKNNSARERESKRETEGEKEKEKEGGGEKSKRVSHALSVKIHFSARLDVERGGKTVDTREKASQRHNTFTEPDGLAQNKGGRQSFLMNVLGNTHRSVSTIHRR